MSFVPFDKIEDVSESAINSLLKSVNRTNDAFFSEFTDLISSLDKTADGYIKTTVSNINKLSKFDKEFNRTLKSSSYYKSVGSYIKVLSENTSLINEYFTALEIGFDPSKSMYDLVRKSGVETTINSLVQSGVDTAFKTPLQQVLKNAVINGSNKAEAISSLKDFIYGSNGRLSSLERYVSQVASDAIHQFNGQYIATIEDDLKLEHYYYRGTKITESRELCIHLAGKYMTYDKLEEYLNKETPWQGMVPGTNMGNFSTYRGGFNCRHMRIPVSKAVYQANIDKSI